jgi:hypothetical protein
VNGASFLWGCRGLAPAVFETRNGLNPFRSEAADGGFPGNARHFPVVKMPRPVGGEIHSPLALEPALKEVVGFINGGLF